MSASQLVPSATVMTRHPIAVIDIGSNSVRLVVYDNAKRSAVPLFNEKALCGLGRGVASTGKLSDSAMIRTRAALSRFMALCATLQVTSVHPFATAAVREARNGGEFVRHCSEICGTDVTVISGKREAELAAMGVIAGFHHPDGIVGDMGGGSLELIEIHKGRISDGVSLPLGGLRLIDMADGTPGRAAGIIDEYLSDIGWLDRCAGRSFYAVGGTWRAFARLHMAQTNYPLSVIHGYSLSHNAALKFTHLIDHLSPEALEGVQAISRSRREVMPYGSILLDCLIKRAHPAQVCISATGVREGFLYELLSAEQKRLDPLLAACADLAALRSRSADHAHELGPWTDQIFALPELDEQPDQRRLRHAACLISDIYWRSHPDYRGEQSLNLIAHAAFVGLDHPGRAFLALTVYFRHEGVKESLSPWLQTVVDEPTMLRARILGASLRAVHMLSAAMPGVIPHTPLTINKQKLVLELPEKLHALDGERLRKRFRKLADLLGRSFELKLVKKTSKLKMDGLI